MKRIIVAIILLGSVVAGYGSDFYFIRDLNTRKLYPEHTVITSTENFIFISSGENNCVILEITYRKRVENAMLYYCVDQYKRNSVFIVKDNGQIFWKTEKFYTEFVR